VLNEKRRNESEPVGRSSDRLVVYLRFALRCDMPTQHHIKEEISIFDRDTFSRGFEVEQTPDHSRKARAHLCLSIGENLFECVGHLIFSSMYHFVLLCCICYCHDIDVEYRV
jgi:hypothetical protein